MERKEHEINEMKTIFETKRNGKGTEDYQSTLLYIAKKKRHKTYKET